MIPDYSILYRNTRIQATTNARLEVQEYMITTRSQQQGCNNNTTILDQYKKNT